jgi:hypothetical protein
LQCLLRFSRTIIERMAKDLGRVFPDNGFFHVKLYTPAHLRLYKNT